MKTPRFTWYLFCLISIGLLASCKKDSMPPEEKVNTPTPSEVINDITTRIADADSISLFVNALKKLPLKQEDVATGLTVFAPLNPSDREVRAIAKFASIGPINDFTANDLTDSVMMDHLIGGVVGRESLTNGKKLTTLSGKELLVTVIDGEIWINGVPLSDEISSDDKQVVFTIKMPLTGTEITDVVQTTTIEVDVRNSMGWASNLPKGTPAVGATVKLYKSQADYANQIVAYQATTDTMGKVRFEDITPATYFIEASEGDRSNLPVKNVATDGLVSGLAIVSILQSDDEIAGSPSQYGVVGNLKWLDANADGKIDNSDFVTLPSDQTTAMDRLVTKVEVLIGYPDNSLKKPITPEVLAQELTAMEIRLFNWNADLAVLDALLVQDAVIGQLSNQLTVRFQRIGDFSFDPASPLFVGLWNTAYNVIGILDALETRIPAGQTNSKLRVLRAFTYLRLMNYFGNVPLYKQPGSLNNQQRNEAYTFVRGELQAVYNDLPQRASGVSTFSQGVADMLLARLALLERDYAKVAEHAGKVIASGVYMLAKNQEAFKPNSPEVVWGSPEPLSGAIKSFFFDRTAMSFLRLKEAYLMFVEANVELNKLNTAAEACNTLLVLSGNSPLDTAATAANIRDKNREMWMSQMQREGVKYANMVGWETAIGGLVARGYIDPKHRLMPIPQNMIDNNVEMLQNPGY